MAKYVYVFLGSSSSMPFPNVIPILVLLWTLLFFKPIFAQFANLKLILMFLLIVYNFYFIPQIALTSTYQFQVIRVE